LAITPIVLIPERLSPEAKDVRAVEITIVRAASALDKPLLAICSGIQLLNVALDGTLHQHIGDVLEDDESRWDKYHAVDVNAGSRVARAMSTERRPLISSLGA